MMYCFCCQCVHSALFDKLVITACLCVCRFFIVYIFIHSHSTLLQYFLKVLHTEHLQNLLITKLFAFDEYLDKQHNSTYSISQKPYDYFTFFEFHDPPPLTYQSKDIMVVACVACAAPKIIL